MAKSKKAPKVLFVDYCAKDFLNGTQTLGPWEELAYRRICDMIYVTEDKLPDDDKNLRWQTKVGNRWPRVKKVLIAAGKISVTEDGRITNDRCQETLENSLRKIAQKSGAGTASADARKQLKMQEIEATDVGVAVATAGATTQGSKDPRIEEKKSAGAGKGAGGWFAEQDGVLIDAIPVEVSTAPPVGQPPPAPPDDPVAEVVMPVAGHAKPIQPWLRLIQVFDEVRTQVFGEHMARAYPDANDKTFAERWLKLGADEDLCRAVFFKKFEDAKKDDDKPPYTLKFCNDSVERAVSRRRRIQNMPIEGNIHHDKRNFGIDARPQSAHGSLLAAAAVVDAQLRKAKSHA